MTRGQKTIMDAVSISFGKQNKITVSRGFAIVLLIIFISCLLATGLLVYNFTSCTLASECENIERNESIEQSTQFMTEESDFSTTFLPPLVIAQVPSNKTEDVRLPTSIVPDLYDIKLIPFIYEGNFTFQGEVKIVINATALTDNITLHSDELVIDEASVRVSSWGNNSDQTISILQIHTDSIKQFLIIHLAENLQPDHQYYITIKFVGILNDLLQGFYRSSYRANGEMRWIAATQFQPTDARKAFPCFDEPAFKAKFKISLAHLENMTTISNMPKIHSEPIDHLNGYFWDHYQESMPMSTYLVAFVVSDFVYNSNGSFSVWTRKDAIPQANFSLEIGPQLLHFYQEFFNIPFPLPKIDMIALPDFSGGAMENWGLITYRESAMLYDEIVSTRTNKQRIAAVIAHELAHQWFGNLVTPKWWSDLWLNEGFATYMEYIGTDAVQPSWKVLDQFVVNELQSVFALDALKSSHQISVSVYNPNEINDIFDRISYAKGATILRMMEYFLTSEVFKRGLHNYLLKNEYGNADQDDLWNALTEQAYKDGVLETDTSIKEIMDTWTLQTGFPIVHAIRNYKDNSVTFTQTRYSLDPLKTETGSPLWWIPITYSIKNEDGINSIWMKAERSIQTQLKSTGKDWLLVNYEQRGYYRVNYDVENWKLLTSQLLDERNYVKFTPANRAQMLDDSLNFAASGYLDYAIALNLTRYLYHERDYVPWKAAFTALDYLQEMFVRTAHFDKFKTYFLSLINGIYIKVGFKESYRDSQLTVYNRVDVLWRACLLGHNDCVMNAVTMFQNWRNSPDPDTYNPISPNLKSVVYCTAIRAGGQDEWDFAWKRYLNTNVGSERDLILLSLGCSRETWILVRYLHWSISEGSGIRKQDSVRVFASVSNNVIGHQLVYNFLKNNWDRIRQYMGSSSQLLNSVVKTSTCKFNTREEVDDLKEFFKSNKSLAVASRAFEQLIEQGEANVRWMNKNFDNIVRWLSTFKTAI